MPLKSFNSIRISNYAESPHSQTPVRAFIMPLLFDLIPPSLDGLFLEKGDHRLELLCAVPCLECVKVFKPIFLEDDDGRKNIVV